MVGTFPQARLDLDAKTIARVTTTILGLNTGGSVIINIRSLVIFIALCFIQGMDLSLIRDMSRRSSKPSSGLRKRP